MARLLEGRSRGGRGFLALICFTWACCFVEAPLNGRHSLRSVAAAATKQRAQQRAPKAPTSQGKSNKAVQEVIDLEDFDAWEVLDLNPDADKQKIRRRFRKLVATQHPDRRPNDPDAVVKFMRIKKAYEQLMGSDSSLKELKQWAEENREWSESAREFLGEEEDLPPPEVPPALYAGLAILLVVLAYGTYWALHK